MFLCMYVFKIRGFFFFTEKTRKVFLVSLFDLHVIIDGRLASRWFELY